jgi:hypothetical protein
MENRTEIGKAIKNKLADLDKSPNDFVWSKIETDLNKKRNKRILSWIIPSVIAVALLSTVLYFNLGAQDKAQKQEISTKKETNSGVSVQSNQISQDSDSKSNKVSDQLNQNPDSKPNQVSGQKPNQKSSPKQQKSEPDKVTTIKKSKTVKLVKESSKLVTSTNEYEEYEVVKKYKVIIKKEQVTTKPIKLGAVKKTTKPSISKNTSTSVKTNKSLKGNSNKTTKPSKKNKTKKTKSNPFIAEKPKSTNTQKDTLAPKNTENSPKTIETKIDTIAKMDSIKVKRNTTPKREYKKTIYNTQKDESDPDFTVAIFYGPVISGSLNNASMISPSIDNLSKSHPITSHYGVYVKTMYDRIGFRAGFSKINLKTSTRLDKDQLIPNYTNIELKSQINIKETFSGSNEVDLLQKLSYYELPMEFDYAIKKDESKIGMDVFTGFSFLILDKNQLSLKSEKVSMQQIGEAKNISGVNFSYNLGIGISYKLNEKFNLDINPLFKYYLSSFKENGDAKPYSFSLQSGVSYKF